MFFSKGLSGFIEKIGFPKNCVNEGACSGLCFRQAKVYHIPSHKHIFHFSNGELVCIQNLSCPKYIKTAVQVSCIITTTKLIYI